MSCPSVSKNNARFKTFPVKVHTKRCPDGKELMKGAEIPMAFAGGGPYIVRGKQIKGCLAFALDVLSGKFGFKPVLKPAKGFNILIANVRILCGTNFFSKRFFPQIPLPLSTFCCIYSWGKRSEQLTLLR